VSDGSYEIIVLYVSQSRSWYLALFETAQVYDDLIFMRRNRDPFLLSAGDLVQVDRFVCLVNLHEEY